MRSGVEVFGAAHEHRLEQAQFVAEVVARERHVHAGGAGDVTHGNTVKPALRKQSLGRVEDAFARCLRAGTGAGRPCRGRRSLASPVRPVVPFFCIAVRVASGRQVEPRF